MLNNFSQQIWQKNFIDFSYKKISDAPKDYQSLTLNKGSFLEITKGAPKRDINQKSFSEISLPINNQDYEIFQLLEAPNLNPELCEKFPSIKAYIAKSLSSNKTARLSYSNYTGLSVTIYTNEGTLLIKPTDIAKNEYIFYNNKNKKTTSEFECSTIENAKSNFQAKSNLTNLDNDGYLRKYRLAVATTGEFSSFFLTGNEITDTERKATVLAAVNNSLSRINGIFERDFGVTMELIETNDQIIFLDSNTDPFNGDFNSELQNTLDTTIGSDNYDVGHLFVYENSIYGNAGCIACVCSNGEKGSAFTAHSDPNSDDFNLIASHEFGHQFGGYHVQSSSNCRSSVGLQEVEPGSGSTIMSYAGICDPNVQANPDDYFNYVDIRDVIQWTRNDSSCAELISTGNNDPVANAGNDYSIPISTPFILTGTSTDIDLNSNHTYCWEQNNPENPFSSGFPQSTWSLGPLFRSKLPTDVPIRYIPQLEDVVSGNLTPTWEVLPSLERSIDFAFTVRDNATIGAKTDSDLMSISVIDKGAPFTVTSQTANENWNVGETKTITWNAAGTNEAPINVSNVDILLSTDGGFTFPHQIASNIPNNGTSQIIVPSIPQSTNQARIMIKPIGNIFYAINDTDIAIQTSEFSLQFTETEISTCKPNSIESNFTYKTFLGFKDTATFSVENLPENITATFIPETATLNDTEVTLILASNDDTEIGQSSINVLASSADIQRRNVLSLNVYEEQITTPFLIYPENNDSAINSNTNLEWNLDENINNYNLDIATDINFFNIITSATIPQNEYTPNNLDNNTTYYWRVSGENTCNSSPFSNTFSFTTACSITSNITVANRTTNSIDVSWIDTSNASSWEVQAVPAGTQPNEHGIVTTQIPHTLTNLESNTNYDIYLRSLCSATNYSEWTGPSNFTTLANYCNGDKFYDTGGIDGTYANQEYVETLIFPNNGDIVQINFENFQLEPDFDFLTIYDGNDTNAPFIGTYTGSNTPPIITSKTGKGITFVFSSDGSVVFPGWQASVECITISCPEPTDFNYTNLNSNSVDLSWTTQGEETEWLIEYGENGFTKGNGITKTTTNNPVSIEGLNTYTAYDFYITAVCGDIPNEDNSFVVGPLNLRTPCETISAPYTFDVEEQNTFDTIENCWIGNPAYNQANYFWQAQSSTFNFFNNTGPYAAHSGNKYFKTTSSNTLSVLENEANLLMPTINIDNLGTPTLNFFAFLYGEEIGSLHIDVYNNGVWTTDVFVLEGQKQTSNQDLWNEYFVDLSSFTGDVQIRFKSILVSNNNSEIDLDDISIIEKPDCIKPSDITFDNITFDSLQINWQNIYNEDANNYTVQYGPSNFIIGEGIEQDTADTNSIIIDNLTSNTTYDFYLKTNCTNDTSSEWVGPFTTSTFANFCNDDHFYDTGGVDGNYGNSEDYTTTIYPSEGFDQLSVIFNTLELESCCDLLRVYDGINENATLIGSYNGTSLPGTITSTNNTGALTFAFSSDGSVTQSGWDANVICEDSTCLIPTNLITSNITNTSVELDWASRNDESSWFIEYGETGFIPGTGNEISTNSKPYIFENLKSATTYDVYVKPNCNKTIVNEINTLSFTTIPDYCNGDHFYDTGGVDGDYANNENYTTTIYPSDGYNQISVLFNSLEITFNDILRVYDGENTSAPLIAQYSNTTEIPNTIISNNVNGALTFTFSSSNFSSNGAGWDATITCQAISCPRPNNLVASSITTNTVDLEWISNGEETEWIIEYGETGFIPGNGTEVLTETTLFTLETLTPNTTYDLYVKANCGNETSIYDMATTITTLTDYCNGEHFYDTGGANASYSNNENYTTTIYPSEGFNQISVIFNSFQLENCCDFLSIYDGNSTDATLIGSYNGSNSPGTITSNNLSGALTFTFSSDGSVTQDGWDATVVCENVCLPPIDILATGITTNTIDLAWTSRNNETEWTIEYGETGFTPGNGTEILTNTNTFAVDNLNSNTIYDFYVKAKCESETSVYSTLTSVTTHTDYCNGDHFYDTGGANGSYANNEDYTTTIYPSEGFNQVSVIFNSFQLENCCDFLSIYDGNNTDATLIGSYNGSNSPGTITSNNLSGALTFTFSSDGSVTEDGWDATVTCEKVCLPPIDILATNIATNVIDLTWTAIDNETDWLIEYGETGFIPGSGTEVLTNENIFTLDNLTSNTIYDFYIKADCDDGISQNSSTTSITTLADYCNGDHFYDTGGINGDYAVNEEYTTTIYPADGYSELAITFNSFNLELGYDFLTIYDGEDTSATLIGSYTGTNTPGTVISSNPLGALTFSFFSDNIIPSSGWDATVVCQSDILSTTDNNNTIINFKFYPNPVKDKLTIESGEVITKIEIYNLLGQKIINIKPKEEILTDQIDLSRIYSGTYLVKVYADNKLKQFKIIKN